jgi:DNA-binding CsgD family transcriptional regulator
LETKALASLPARLTETATLSKAVGRAALLTSTNALDLVRRPAIALSQLGFVIEVNRTAAALFDDELRIRNRRLIVGDREAAAAIDRLGDRLRITSDTVALTVAPIMVRRKVLPPVIIQVLPVDGAARSPFLGARAILVLNDLARERRPELALLRQLFDFTAAEARLARLIAGGVSPEQAAETIGVVRETVRNQLKAIFAKTGTHRQSELVALLARLD